MFCILTALSVSIPSLMVGWLGLLALSLDCRQQAWALMGAFDLSDLLPAQVGHYVLYLGLMQTIFVLVCRLRRSPYGASRGAGAARET
ncbi:hypothetical protein [Burkholderia glumae]|uniref:hypothetical protein n=1 Tax=Burkholderia glumae TaxID=337 RepID=UPI0013745E48|nr:hypothetical protein [Burkholderia glumae]QHP93603.1 hypothetical protein EXE55_22210 [Burkholderia glumae]